MTTGLKQLIVLASAVALAAPMASAHDAVDARPVMYGLDGPDFDGCGGWGRVKGLNPDGDNFLSVRAAPTTQSSRLDKLKQGHEIWFCDSAKNGEWVGIVYKGEGQDGFECATGPNLDKPRPYPGPCRSGWVHKRYVELLAG